MAAVAVELAPVTWWMSPATRRGCVLFKQPDFAQQGRLPAVSKHSQRGLVTYPVSSRAW